MKVVALGQPFAGDDGAGIAVLRELERRHLPGVLLAHLRDATALVELMLEGEKLLIVDAAVVGEARVGEVLELTEADLQEQARSAVSSHGLSVSQALRLARTLASAQEGSQLEVGTSEPRAEGPSAPGISAPEVHLVAVGIQAPGKYRDGLSPAVHAGVQAAADRVEQIVRCEGA